MASDTLLIHSITTFPLEIWGQVGLSLLDYGHETGTLLLLQGGDLISIGLSGNWVGWGGGKMKWAGCQASGLATRLGRPVGNGSTFHR